MACPIKGIFGGMYGGSLVDGLIPSALSSRNMEQAMAATASKAFVEVGLMPSMDRVTRKLTWEKERAA